METVFLSMPKNEFQAVIIDCVKACLEGQLQDKSSFANAEQPLVTEDTAVFLNLEEPTIYKHVKNRTIPFHKKGRKLYFFKSELVAWIKSGQVKTCPELATDAESAFLKAQTRRGTKSTISTSSNAL
jgi:excisionase family DNA binding protein